MSTIYATAKFQFPPEWAVLERRLIDAMNAAVEPVMKKYVRKDGSLLWPTRKTFRSIDGLDDAYESFHNWPLFYAMGGADKFKELSLFEYDAITRQFTQYDCGHGHPMVVKEYEQGYDWMHQGEGYVFFYMLGLADPHNPVTQARACRYAGFYLNEDPDAPNYDASLKLVRCAHVGSMGPAFRNFTNRAWGYADWKTYYGLPFQDVPGFDSMDALNNTRAAVNMARAMKRRMGRGDVATNLAITGMMTNAYLHTGEDKYKNWVLEYLGAWVERTQANGGILPDNIGLSGKIGEYIDGKWYGGYYGWTWPHGWAILADPVTLAGEDALLLTGDSSYLDLTRSQMDLLISRGIEKNGTLHVPNKFGDPGCYEYKVWLDHVLTENLEPNQRYVYNRILWKDGWFEYTPMQARVPVHVWHLTQDPRDLERIMRIRNYYLRDWETLHESREKDQGGHDAAWAAYLSGAFPNYPEQILRLNIQQVEQRVQFMAEDTQPRRTYNDAYLQRRNPITLEGLANLTLGAPLPLYNGGHLMATVRYFNRAQNRPGLPEDVGALVERIEANQVTLVLANLNPDTERKVGIQAGGYGEHRFTGLREITGGVTGPQQDINAGSFEVILPPQAIIRLEVGMQKFCQSPRFAGPWD